MNDPLPHSTLAWRQADDDVYVATVAAEYAGFTDRTPRGIRAHGARGEDLGLHPTQSRARAAVAASIDAQAPRRLPSRLHRAHHPGHRGARGGAGVRRNVPAAGSRSV